jgi:hypothetical protein
MRAIRGTEVPLEHVAAELAAVPLASDASLTLSVTELDPRMGGTSAPLWRAAESSLLKSFSSLGIEEITALRDWLWFDGKTEKPMTMVEFVRTIADAALVFSGNVFRPKTPPWAAQASHGSSGSSDARGRRFWRWVSFALPPDLLMAAHPAPGAVSSEVELLSPILQSILRDRGYVEPHMHLGAAIDFSLLWISTLHAIGDPDMVTSDAFQNPGAEMKEGRELASWLLRAAVARYVLASYLAHRRSRQSKTGMSFDSYLIQEVFPLFSLLKADEKEGSSNWQRGVYVDPGRGAGLRLCLHELARGGLIADTPFHQLQRLYTQLTQLRGRWPVFPKKLEQAWQADPIGSMFPPRGKGQRTAEMEFVATAFEYMETEPGKEDLSFQHLFWQTQRVRVKFYRHVVQRPLTPGLQWFTRFYARLHPGRRPLGIQALVASAAEVCGKDFGLRSLELRISPYPDHASLREMLVDVGEGLRDLGLTEQEVPVIGEDSRWPEIASWLRRRIIETHEPEDPHKVHLPLRDGNHPEVGLVFHFIRERGGGAREGAPWAHGQGSYADPGWKENFGFRYARYYRQRRREALTLAGMLRRFPQLLALIRGVDVCTDELGVPNWVIAPLLRYVKDVAGAASSYAQASLGRVLPPLRTTAHAGEDFVHLASGLRRIEESIWCFRLGQGDRLGHAIALGVNPREWASRVGGIAMTRIERLFDLAWEWWFCTERSLDLPAGRTQYIIDQIENLSKEIFNSYHHPPQVAEFMKLLRDERELRIARFPDGPLDEEREYMARHSRSRSKKPAQGGPDDRARRDDNQNDPGEDPWRLLYAYLTDPAAFAKGQHQVLVDPLSEAGSLETIQMELRRIVGAAGITVEINPSSNLLIGNLSDLQNHPLWRLKSPQKATDAPVAVCIGSDDPITFATRNREEYQLVYDTLTLAGISDTEARQWLEEVRQAGLESRFTLPLPQEWNWIPHEVDIEHLHQLL